MAEPIGECMKALKIAGTVAVIAWMAWITWQIETIQYQSAAACGLARTALELEAKHIDGGISSLYKVATPQRCALFMILGPNPMPPR